MNTTQVLRVRREEARLQASLSHFRDQYEHFLAQQKELDDLNAKFCVSFITLEKVPCGHNKDHPHRMWSVDVVCIAFWFIDCWLVKKS